MKTFSERKMPYHRSSDLHKHLVSNARNPLRMDPSRTLTLRRSFVAEVARRMRKLRQIIKEAFAADKFQIKEKPLTISVFNAYEFRSSRNRLNDFKVWLAEQVDEEARGLIPLHVNCRCIWLPK